MIHCTLDLSESIYLHTKKDAGSAKAPLCSRKALHHEVSHVFLNKWIQEEWRWEGWQVVTNPICQGEMPCVPRASGPGQTREAETSVPTLGGAHNSWPACPQQCFPVPGRAACCSTSQRLQIFSCCIIAVARVLRIT